ncbi:MAG: hypothetical protein V4719_18260 [Planctomycetota bacterium]
MVQHKYRQSVRRCAGYIAGIAALTAVSVVGATGSSRPVRLSDLSVVSVDVTDIDLSGFKTVKNASADIFVSE